MSKEGSAEKALNGLQASMPTTHQPLLLLIGDGQMLKLCTGQLQWHSAVLSGYLRTCSHLSM